MTYKDEKDYDAINGYNYYKKYLDEFIDNWSHVERVDELIDILKSLEDNEVFCRMGYLEMIYDRNDETFTYNQRKFPFMVAALNGLGHDHLIPIYVPEITRKIVNRDDFVCTYFIVGLSYVTFSGHYLKYDEDKIIKLSDIIPALTFFVEDFDTRRKIPDFDVNFFKQLHHLYWLNKDAKKLDDAVGRVFRSVFGMWCLNFATARTFHRAAFYLMGCNALKNNRDGICVDDVVVGYLTAFKVVLNDIRPVIQKLYDEDKWKDAHSWR